MKQGKRIGAGGEATVYEGSYKGRAIVIREFHPPDGGDWESQDGRFIHKVPRLFIPPFLDSAYAIHVNS